MSLATVQLTNNAKNETLAEDAKIFHPDEYSLLIIDDDEDLGLYLQAELKQMGFRVHMRSSPKEGLLLLNRIYFDLLICDLNMPQLNGWDLIKEVRKVRTIPIDSRLPIIVLSSTNPLHYHQDGKLDADAFCEKRNAQRDLIPLIQEVLKGH